MRGKMIRFLEINKKVGIVKCVCGLWPLCCYCRSWVWQGSQCSLLSSPFPVGSTEEKEAQEEEDYHRNTQKSTSGHGYVIEHTCSLIEHLGLLYCVGLHLVTFPHIYPHPIKKRFPYDFQTRNMLCLFAFRLRWITRSKRAHSDRPCQPAPTLSLSGRSLNQWSSPSHSWLWVPDRWFPYSMYVSENEQVH